MLPALYSPHKSGYFSGSLYLISHDHIWPHLDRDCVHLMKGISEIIPSYFLYKLGFWGDLPFGMASMFIWRCELDNTGIACRKRDILLNTSLYFLLGTNKWILLITRKVTGRHGVPCCAGFLRARTSWPSLLQAYLPVSQQKSKYRWRMEGEAKMYIVGICRRGLEMWQGSLGHRWRGWASTGCAFSSLAHAAGWVALFTLESQSLPGDCMGESARQIAKGEAPTLKKKSKFITLHVC